MAKRPLKRKDVEFGFECSVELSPGPGRTSYCSECDKRVWDVSKLTRGEFDNLPKTACVVLRYDDDGIIEFAPEPSVSTRLRNAAAAGLMGLILAGCEVPTPVHGLEPGPTTAQATEQVAEQHARQAADRPTVEQPIPLDESTATIPKKISRAMLLEIHREMYGEYPTGRTAPDPPTSTDQSAEFPGGNHRDILQRKRNIRERRKKSKPTNHTMGALIITDH